MLESAPARFSAIAMEVTADHDDRELLEKLVVMSERACIVANTLKSGTPLSVSVG